MSKRPDREQMAFALFLHESGQDEAFLRRVWEGHPAGHPVKLNYYGLADAAISSLALEPEAREEPKHGLIEDYTAVQAPDWTKISGKLDTREITDADASPE